MFERILYLDLIQVHLVHMLLAERMGISREIAVKMGAGFGGGGGAGKKGGGAGKGEEKAEEEEKTHFDVRLVGYEAKMKIKVIKEVRAMTGLGLKEAKEMVEGFPRVVMKEIKKDDVEGMKDKLEAVGAQLEIVW